MSHDPEQSARWRKRRLGEVLRIRHGFAFKGEYFSDSGQLILLTPGNFHEGGGFKPKDGAEKFYSGPVPDGFILKKDSLVVVMTEQAKGLLGSSALIPEEGVYLHNQRIGLVDIIKCEEVDSRFLYYLFNTSFVRNHIQATATGSKVRHTAPSRIEDVVVEMPPLPVQRTIAQALGVLDSLVENNRRRIDILEKVARLIYEEWFVRFRFPGHDDLELVESDFGPVPRGWKVGHLGDAVDVNRASVQKGDKIGLVCYIDISSVGPRALGEPDVLEFAEAPGRARRKVQHGDVIWSTVRPGRRSHALILDPMPGTICSTGFAVLTPRGVPSSFLYEWSSTDQFAAYLESRATGSAYPAVRPSDFEAAPMVVPATQVLERFDESVGRMHRLQESLRRQNAVLQEAHDLLLPRLLSGELDISQLGLELEAVR